MEIVEINLEDRSFETYELDEKLFYDRLGGRGLGLHFLKRERDCIAILRGVLSKVPGIPGRACACYISPKTKGVFYSNSGGNIQWMKPYALVLKGKSENKVILKIDERKVEFLDGRSIWDLDVCETFNVLGKKFKQHILLSIGNANSVNECLSNNKHGFFGRGGLGYLLREKNVKALVIETNNGFSTKPTEKYYEIYKLLIKKLKKNKIINELSESGTVGMLLKELGARGLLPVAINYKKYLSEWFKHKKINRGCLGCPIQCKKNFEFWGGLISFYFQGMRDLIEIENSYKEYNQLGIDTVSDDNVHVIDNHNKIAMLSLATSNRGDVNQLILTRLFRENMKMENIDAVNYIISVQNEIAVLDSLVTCGFTLYAWDLHDYSKILESLGYSFTEAELSKFGEKIYKEEIELNKKLGFKYKIGACKEHIMEEYFKKRGISM